MIHQRLSGLALIGLSCAVLAAGEVAPPYLRKDTWQETLRLSREALAAQEDEALARSPLGDGVVISPWHVVGPFRGSNRKSAFAEVYPPEHKVDLAEAYDKKTRWQKKAEWLDGVVIELEAPDNAAFYLYRTIAVKSDRWLPVWLGSDDGLAVWLNGQKVLSKDVGRGVEPNQENVKLALKKGENALLLKIHNQGGGCGFYFSTSEDPGPLGRSVRAREQLWDRLAADFPSAEAQSQMAWERADHIWRGDWRAGSVDELAKRYANATRGVGHDEAQRLAREAKTPADLDALRKLYYASRRAESLVAGWHETDLRSLRLGVEDLRQSFGSRYPKGPEYLQRLEQCEKEFADLRQAGALDAKNARFVDWLGRFDALRREALLANPLFDFERLLVLRRNFPGAGRKVMGSACGLIGLNSHTNDDIPHRGWDNEIGIFSNLRNGPKYQTLYRSPDRTILRDLDLEFDGERIMFSGICANDRWAIFEIRADGSGLKQLSPVDLSDVDFFDSCYLPDGRIVTASTAGYQGLPCESGGKPMVNLYQLDLKKNAIRQLTFEQDSDWHPTTLNDGRVMYLRWEYTDSMHYYSRRLFVMNPDGTGQLAYYGSGSMFPPAFKFAKAIPGDPSKVVGIIAGHHDFPEHGRLAVVNPWLNDFYPFRYRPKSKEWGKPGSYMNAIPEILPAEKTGFVNEIPGYGQNVVGNVCDGIAQQAWKEGKPQFLHPWPLSDKHFLVSMKRNANALWGIYLVDLFDNMTLVAEIEDAVLFQPIPLRARPRPPIIPDRINLNRKTADVHISDIHAGPGLQGIPRGTVKSLRVVAYHYAYLGRGGHASLGVESSWDVKRVLGTTPVEADGSAQFQIPANTPVFLQPLDQDGAALQLMRTWFVGMPGEYVSCVGCHENRRTTLPIRKTIAGQREALPLKPWYGESRPFAFEFEVYPLVQRRCVGCHDGTPAKNGAFKPSFKDARKAYDGMHPYTNRPGPESDMALLPPMEYHASTSPLVQMLKKGHHGVALNPEEWERLYCWIDLNVPFKGAWLPGTYRGQPQQQRRKELAQKFAGLDADPEDEYRRAEQSFRQRPPETFVVPVPPAPAGPDGLQAEGWPLDAEAAVALQKRQAKGDLRRTVTLDGGFRMDLAFIPSGTFVMGSLEGYPDERPRQVVKIGKPFWMGVCEVTNAQYEAFDPTHDTRYIDEHGKDHCVPGYIANHPDQPVARVSWQEAMAFCKWMGDRSGLKVTLPTEAQWEWAARAGTATPFFYGDLDTDFGKFANLADRQLRFTNTSFPGGSNLHNRLPYPPEMNFPLRDDRFEDRWFVVDYVGQCEPNAWGLKDMIGNVCEWTRSSYRQYPYKDDDGRNDGKLEERKAVRGGSWADRPKDAGSSVRRAYETHQKVFNVGFRVIVEQD